MSKDTLTVWKDGSFLVQSRRDAEYSALCEPSDVILTFDLSTHEAVNFITPAERLRLFTFLFGGKKGEQA